MKNLAWGGVTAGSCRDVMVTGVPNIVLEDTKVCWPHLCSPLRYKRYLHVLIGTALIIAAATSVVALTLQWAGPLASWYSHGSTIHIYATAVYLKAFCQSIMVQRGLPADQDVTIFVGILAFSCMGRHETFPFIFSIIVKFTCGEGDSHSCVKIQGITILCRNGFTKVSLKICR